jgi:hypothetical protein
VFWIVRYVTSTTTLRRDVLRACMAARYLKDVAEKSRIQIQQQPSASAFS